MTDLERQVEELRQQVAALAERVRLDAVAEAFLVGRHEIREGDYFLQYGESHVTRLASISSDGKWTYDAMERARDQTQVGHKRLYTIEEVAEILVKAQR